MTSRLWENLNLIVDLTIKTKVGMLKTITYILSLLILLLSNAAVCAQTISEKKAGLGEQGGTGDLSAAMRASLTQVNQELEAQEKELQILYKKATELYIQNAPVDLYRELLTEINAIKERRANLEQSWREMALQENVEEYALWHQPNTTLEQLIMDYGSLDYVYLIPPSIAGQPLSVNSNLPIPRAAWNEMLELILTQNGIGVKQLNPYLRELYLLQQDKSAIKLITNRRHNLSLLPSNDRIAFMLSPEPSDVRRVWFFMEKFVNPNSVVLQQIGRDILIVAEVSEVLELLKIYDFVSANRGDKDYKVVPVSRVDAQEITKILGAVFGVLTEPPSTACETPLRQVGRPQTPLPNIERPHMDAGDNGLQVIPLAQIANAVFLIGTREEIRKAERIIHEVECQVGEAQGKVVYWYTTKHTNAEELAEVLSRIYYLMVSTGTASCEGEEPCDNIAGSSSQSEASANSNSNSRSNSNNSVRENINVMESPYTPLGAPYNPGFPFPGPFVVNRVPRPPPPEANFDRDNFIVDLKTGSIVMVVETNILPKLKEIIRKFDVPKKMVQLEVLLFEKVINRENDYGLHLLKTGCKASNTNCTAVTFNVIADTIMPVGIFDFFISRKKTGSSPAFDAIYRFLLTQENINIHASPSVLAINQTPATIEIAQEISVNTGTYSVNTVGGVTLQDAFARAQYGIIIDITPTIYTQNDESIFYTNSEDYVTLQTDVTFQTINPSVNSRPDVTTRHIVNEVRIPDRQTVILGGLRQRNTRDAIEKIPFLGEFPGVGKLFSFTEIRDNTTEMFIFITPTIIYDPSEDLQRVRCCELCRRPGDIPAFLCCLVQAQEWEKQRLFQSTLTILFGPEPDCCVMPCGEYDGR